MFWWYCLNIANSEQSFQMLFQASTCARLMVVQQLDLTFLSVSSLQCDGSSFQTFAPSLVTFVSLKWKLHKANIWPQKSWWLISKGLAHKPLVHPVSSQERPNRFSLHWAHISSHQEGRVWSTILDVVRGQWPNTAWPHFERPVSERLSEWMSVFLVTTELAVHLNRLCLVVVSKRPSSQLRAVLMR